MKLGHILVLASVLLTPSLAEATFVSADGTSAPSGLVHVGILESEGRSIVTMEVPRGGHYFVVPLPDGASSVRLGSGMADLDRRTAPRSFALELPSSCDPSYSCDVARIGFEPNERGPKPDPSASPESKKPPPKPDDRNDGCLGWPLGNTEALERATSPSPPSPTVSLVSRDALIEAFDRTSHGLLPNQIHALPAVRTFAIVLATGLRATLSFEVNGPFVLPIVPASAGGPREIIVYAGHREDSASTFFPRELLAAEPPRLYEMPRPAVSPVVLAAALAEQLARSGKPVQLERVATLPEAAPLGTRLVSLGVTALGKPKNPSAPSVEWTLFRYRARGLSRLTVEAMPRGALPHPREPATAFVTVDPTPDDPSCPLAKATCYRRSRQSEWIARLPQGPSISTSESDVAIAELPYGTATPFVREASPFPTNGNTPARAVSEAPSADPRSTMKQAVVRPATCGCACTSVPEESPGGSAGFLALAVAVGFCARRRR